MVKSAPLKLSETTMKLSPFPVLIIAFIVGIVWADNDAKERFKRCTKVQSLSHCHLVFHGR